MQPPHALTLQKLVSELQDALDRDEQFIERGEELLTRWKAIAQQMEERLRAVLEAEPQVGSSSS